MISLETDRRPHLPVPSFWSGQFGVNIKGAGVCSFGDEIVFTQGLQDSVASPPHTEDGAASSAPSRSTMASGFRTTPR